MIILKILNKNGRVHLDIQTHRKNPIGIIRCVYRDSDGKTKRQSITRITHLSLEKLKLIQATLQDKTTHLSEFNILSSKEYGASFAAVELLKDIGLDKKIYSRSSETWVRDCIAMIVGRLIYQNSKLALSKSNSFSSLWEICGISDEIIDVETHCYESMDRLLERQNAIQKSLADKHLTDGTLVLYDITSSYMEGEYEDSELVEYGYNRDQKRGHKQVVIALLCNKEGCPIATEVFPGNTKDETTVIDKINEIKQKFGIEDIIFVGDRGMVTKARYDEIDHDTVKVISAITHNDIKTLCEKDIIQMGLFDDSNIIEIINDDIRYCLCRNPDMAVKETKTRRVLLDKTAVELDKVIKTTRKTKYSKEVRAGKVINKFKMGKFVTLEGSGNNLSWKFDEQKIAQEQFLDGCYIIFTDIQKEDMTALETVNNYKNLIKVEQAFRNLKTVTLEIRPMYHKKDDRIKCHVFICMLAYYLMWHMNKRLLPLFELDGKGKNRKYTFDYIMESLKSIRANAVDFCGNLSTVITKPTDEQKNIFDLLGVAI